MVRSFHFSQMNKVLDGFDEPILYDWLRLKDALYLRFELWDDFVSDTKYHVVYRVVFHSDNYHDIHNEFHMPSERRNVVHVYHLYKTKLFKDPYTSRCIDYRNPLETQDSFFHCMIKFQLSEYKKIPMDMTIPTHYNATRMTSDYKIRNKCHERYNMRPLCDDTFYDQRAIRSSQIFRTIGFLPPLGQTINEFFPKTSLFDLSILICDVFGLWLGISLCFVLKKVVQLTDCSHRKDFLVGH